MKGGRKKGSEDDDEDLQLIEAEGGYSRMGLPIWRKITFGMGGIAIGIMNSAIGYFQLAFLLEVVQVTAFWAGIILLIKQVWDAVTDPVIGFISDNYPCYYGRRKPWIYIFIFPLFTFWILSWNSPGFFFMDETFKNCYFLIIFMFFSLFLSFVVVPFYSIIPEIATSSLERTSVIMILQVFVIFGSTISSVLWSSAILYFPNDEDDYQDYGMPTNYRKSYSFSSFITGALIVISILFAIQFVGETKSYDRRESFFVKLRKIFPILIFVPFIIIAFMSCLSMFSIFIFMSNIYLFFKYVLLLEAESNLLLLTLQVGFSLLFLFSWDIDFSYCCKFTCQFALPNFLLVEFFLIIFCLNFRVQFWYHW